MVDISSTKTPRVTLDQWRALQAVVDYGGFAQAAEKLHRSQSSVSYAVSKLQQQLGVQLLEIQGRKAQLTEAGATLLRRSRQLMGDAMELEQLARSMEQGWEAEVNLVVDAAFPSCTLMAVLKQFAESCPSTRVQLNEVVMSGADEALLEGRANLAIAGPPPKGFLGDQIMAVDFVAVAHRDHALHQMDRPLTNDDLRRELQVVIRDSGHYIKKDMGWLGAEHRWTVTSIDTATEAIANGLGFGWLPHHQVEGLLRDQQLLPLPLREGLTRTVQMYMIFGHSSHIGPATQRLADIFRSVCGEKSE